MSGPAIIFDTETTSLEDDREIIEAAWIRVAEVGDLAGPSEAIPSRLIVGAERFVRRYKPARPIGYGAMAVHHILPSELENCPPSSEFALPADIEYIAGHNIDFDWQAAGKPEVKRICTDAMARWTWPDCDSYSQSALLYRLLGPTEETRERLAGAHAALMDVANCALLLEQILAAKPEIMTWSALYEYSEACRIPRVCPLGKHKGMPLDELVEYDLSYVDWMLRQDWLDEYLRKGLEQAVERYHTPF